MTPRLPPRLQGSLVALITPMHEDGSLDARAYAEFIEWQLAEGTDGLVPVGTTGESPTLSHDEHKRVVEACIQATRGRVPVVAGAGSNSTDEAIDFSLHARAAGADATLVVAPYYNKPTQEGLFLHFSAIADAADVPMLLYNVPSRCVVDILPETMGRLAAHRNIIGVKDATANLARPLQQRATCGADFIQLTGEDHTALAFNASGGVGCISVTANVAPRLCAEMQKAWREGRLSDALKIQDRLLPVHDALFCETSPGPVKYAASLLGKASAFCRLPMAPVAASTRERVETAMRGAGLLN